MKQVHGGDVYRHPDAIDFSSNMNLLGTPEAVIRAASESLKNIRNYPDVFQTELINALSDYEGVPREYFFCGNGAAEVIFAWALALRPGRALILAPTFSEYEQALRAAGSEVVRFALTEEHGFEVTPDLPEAIAKESPDAVILCNPNNPTGLLIEPSIMAEVRRICRENGIHLMVDECFQDFLDDRRGQSIRPHLAEEPNLFLLNAFTKRYAMAGIRLGYGMTSDTELIEQMHTCVQPWNVSIPAQAAGAEALRHENYVEEARRIVHIERAYLKEEMKKLGLTVYDSMANYIFFRGPEGLAESMAGQHILIRSCDNYHGLDGSYYRTAVRTRAENDKLLEALRVCLKG